MIPKPSIINISESKLEDVGDASNFYLDTDPTMHHHATNFRNSIVFDDEFEIKNYKNSELESKLIEETITSEMTPSPSLNKLLDMLNDKTKYDQKTSIKILNNEDLTTQSTENQFLSPIDSKNQLSDENLSKSITEKSPQKELNKSFEIEEPLIESFRNPSIQPEESIKPNFPPRKTSQIKSRTRSSSTGNILTSNTHSESAINIKRRRSFFSYIKGKFSRSYDNIQDIDQNNVKNNKNESTKKLQHSIKSKSSKRKNTTADIPSSPINSETSLTHRKSKSVSDINEIMLSDADEIEIEIENENLNIKKYKTKKKKQTSGWEITDLTKNSTDENKIDTNKVNKTEENSPFINITEEISSSIEVSTPTGYRKLVETDVLQSSFSMSRPYNNLENCSIMSSINQSDSEMNSKSSIENTQWHSSIDDDQMLNQEKVDFKDSRVKYSNDTSKDMNHTDVSKKCSSLKINNSQNKNNNILPPKLPPLPPSVNRADHIAPIFQNNQEKQYILPEKISPNNILKPFINNEIDNSPTLLDLGLDLDNTSIPSFGSFEEKLNAIIIESDSNESSSQQFRMESNTTLHNTVHNNLDDNELINEIEEFSSSIHFDEEISKPSGLFVDTSMNSYHESDINSYYIDDSDTLSPKPYSKNIQSILNEKALLTPKENSTKEIITKLKKRNSPDLLLRPNAYLPNYRDSGRPISMSFKGLYHQSLLNSEKQVDTDSESIRSISKNVQNTSKTGAAQGKVFVRFSPEVTLHDTYSLAEYDRTPDVATCNELTPLSAQFIKIELNEFKNEMEIHEDSKCFTHFY
ncbi:hypothetical protein TBLA_0B00170 [Henningerozyma blattae CBS 6284]|uniref:Uncharacterized protein n=1 Tax=Henningerozyma blattae (strain ATCC 34711 / CBS 6284 / DSM 70876 / NBRC 10599 / NRRL Y-10934 / UCD 77-7) TaxID=1071380 RepID=I2GXL0_HENB6|nr:hypothetical protein TBLA_0B00170 [Tetrapisispora blattae CBS 6284]CCH58862.1 hypothetical protein TBLA_0B00170 [Tetrapisispora blattae CBS 6284]